MSKPVYLDYNASTPVAPEVATAMKGLLEDAFGNPSSTHWAAEAARQAIASARSRVAGLLTCAPDEIVFTSGGSEANNLALKGVFFSAGNHPVHIITSAVEHPAILSPCAFLERLGAKVTRVPVDGTGRIDPDDVRDAIHGDTRLISIMHANNEVGTIEPVEDCARIARDHGILFHTDAAQSAGKIPTRVDDLGADLLSLAGHKFYAPKGIGALFVRRGTVLEPLVHGAGHESGRRAGTESALLIAALGEAARLASDLTDVPRIRELRDRLWQSVQTAFGSAVELNGHPEFRLPNTLSVSFVGRNGAAILSALGNVAASTGSACHSDRIELSPVLQAMGVQPEVGMGAVRFSLGRATSAEDIDSVGRKLEEIC